MISSRCVSLPIDPNLDKKKLNYILLKKLIHFNIFNNFLEMKSATFSCPSLL